MFICEITKKNSLPGEKCNLIPVEHREVEYFRTETLPNGRKVRKVISRGFEIVRTIKVSAEGMKILQGS